MMPSSAVPPSNPALWIPATFVASFLVVLTVNVILIVTAVSSFSGLETDRAYEVGLHYNQTLTAAAANAATGWIGETEVSANGGPERKLIVRLKDAAGAPVGAASLSGKLVRPTNAGMDVALSFTELGEGRYQVAFLPPALGNWELRLVARRSALNWQQSQRLFIK